MATVSLEGMQFHGYHGVYPAERVLGTTFIVDVHIDFDLKSVKNDDLSTAVNYESVYHIVELLMIPPPPLSPEQLARLNTVELASRKEREPRQLIETVAQTIVTKLKKKFDKMQSLTVRIKKMHPALPGRVQSSTIETKEVFLKDCPKCKNPPSKLICYKDENCWCKQMYVHEATREILLQQYDKKCLCTKCLEFYSNANPQGY
jgi:7,8-dihydroneopterin aldolase/epimerase/oxygenase